MSEAARLASIVGADGSSPLFHTDPHDWEASHETGREDSLAALTGPGRVVHVASVTSQRSLRARGQAPPTKKTLHAPGHTHILQTQCRHLRAHTLLSSCYECSPLSTHTLVWLYTYHVAEANMGTNIGKYRFVAGNRSLIGLPGYIIIIQLSPKMQRNRCIFIQCPYHAFSITVYNGLHSYYMSTQHLQCCIYYVQVLQLILAFLSLILHVHPTLKVMYILCSSASVNTGIPFLSENVKNCNRV